MEQRVTQRPTVGLALGGGGARGVAHLGVLKVLERQRIPIDLVVGTSIGALVGAAFASGLSLDAGIRLAIRTQWSDLTDFTFPRMGLNEGRRLERFIRAAVENRGFEDMKMPLGVVTTDVESGDEVVFTSGPLVKAILASCSLPGVFNPVRIGDRLLIDGGVRTTVPVGPARRLGAERVIAVDVGSRLRKRRVTNVIQVITQAFQIKGSELGISQGAEADLLIRPDVVEVDQIDFSHGRELVQKGQEAAEEALPQIRELVGLAG